MKKKKQIFVQRRLKLLTEIIKNLTKDFKIEFRNRITINISLAFAAISTLSISLTSRGIKFSPEINAILLWIIIFFSAMNGLSNIFIREEEKGTSLFLYLNSSPETVYLSKLFFNLLFFFIIELVIVPLAIFFFQISIYDYSTFFLTIISGGIAIASSTTILAAMVSKASGKGSLFTIISFPIVLPILWISTITTTNTMIKGSQPLGNNIVFLLAFSLALILVSYLLFKYIWNER